MISYRCICPTGKPSFHAAVKVILADKTALSNILREERQRDAERLAMIGRLIPVMKQAAELAGFEVVGRITLTDKATGKEYR